MYAIAALKWQSLHFYLHCTFTTTLNLIAEEKKPETRKGWK